MARGSRLLITSLALSLVLEAAALAEHPAKNKAATSRGAAADQRIIGHCPVRLKRGCIRAGPISGQNLKDLLFEKWFTYGWGMPATRRERFAPDGHFEFGTAGGPAPALGGGSYELRYGAVCMKLVPAGTSPDACYRFEVKIDGSVWRTHESLGTVEIVMINDPRNL